MSAYKARKVSTAVKEQKSTAQKQPAHSLETRLPDGLRKGSRAGEAQHMQHWDGQQDHKLSEANLMIEALPQGVIVGSDGHLHKGKHNSITKEVSPKFWCCTGCLLGSKEC